MKNEYKVLHETCSRMADRWTYILLRETSILYALKVVEHSRKVKSLIGQLD